MPPLMASSFSCHFVDSLILKPLCIAVLMKETIIPMLNLDLVITYRTKESFVVKCVPQANCVAQQV